MDDQARTAINKIHACAMYSHIQTELQPSLFLKLLQFVGRIHCKSYLNETRVKLKLFLKSSFVLSLGKKLTITDVKCLHFCFVEVLWPISLHGHSAVDQDLGDFVKKCWKRSDRLHVTEEHLISGLPQRRRLQSRMSNLEFKEWKLD